MKPFIVLLISALCLGILTLKTKPDNHGYPAVGDNGVIKNVDDAQSLLSRLQRATSTPGLFALEIHHAELIALADSLSDLESGTHYQFELHDDTLSISVQKRIFVFRQPFYLSLICDIENQSFGTAIDQCTVGHIPIPGALAQRILKSFINSAFSEHHGQLFDNVLSGAVIGPNILAIVAEKPSALVEQDEEKGTLQDTLAKAWFSSQFVSQQSVETYINYLSTLQIKEGSLAEPMFRAFEYASQAPNGLPPEKENQAATWALAIAFGSKQFSQFIGEKNAFSWAKFPSSTLAKRHDLALHFLFSAVLFMVGNAEIALSVGQFKEFSDSLPGGSGFSFPDLAADKAGLKFAEFATSSKAGALTVQCLLTGSPNESVFFPDIRGLPEGLSEHEFTEQFGDKSGNNIADTKTPHYSAMENLIDTRITTLPVFQESYLALCGGSE